MKYIIFSSFIFFIFLSLVQSQEKKMVKAWFPKEKFSSLEITRIKTGQKSPTHQLKITDTELIGKFIGKIEQISPNGDMMKSMLMDEEITLIFKAEKVVEAIINIYDGRIQTPSTGYNSDNKNRELEKKLYTEIKALLH